MAATYQLTNTLRKTGDASQLFIVLGLAFYCVLLLLLRVAPYWFPTDPGIASQAAALGYNNAAAYYLMVFWLVSCIAACALAERSRFGTQRADEDPIPGRPVSAAWAISRSNLVEIVIVFAFSVAIYFPWALARYGPYIEDNYLLTALHRMDAGKIPYLDFEFPYGPLMLYLAYGWTKIVGYTMVGYFALIAFLAALQYSILWRVLQRFFPTFRIRLSAFLLVGPLVFDTLLALNYNGIRRLLPIFVLVLVASPSTTVRTLIATSLSLGLLLGYSPEVGACCLLSLVAMYALMAAAKRSLRCARYALTVAGLSVAVWFASSVTLLGKAFPSYLESSAFLMKRFSAGESGFAFYWTANSLSLFALLTLACILVGRGLGKWGPTEISSGDRLFFGAVIYALLGLKSGLNRADMWHLASPMFPLVFALILPYPRNLFAFSKQVHKVALTLLAIMAVTYLAGLAPSGSYYASGLTRGFSDLIATGPPVQSQSVVTRGPSIELERSHPDPNVLRLASYLADKGRSDRAVVFYGVLWSMDKRVGVTKPTYPTDDFLMSEQMGYNVRDTVRKTGAIVVMDDGSYERLFGDFRNSVDRASAFYEETPAKAILKWLSSAHFAAIELETLMKQQRWDKTVGPYLQSHYHKTATFGWYVVVERKPERDEQSID
jgi:hypothetical protein